MKKILHVEDSKFYSESAKRLFTRRGYTYEVAVNGADAIDFLETNGALPTSINVEPSFIPDAIICDFDMPVMNGANFISTIRHMGYSGLIIGCSNAYNKELMEAGADNCMPKDFQGYDFEVTIRSWEDVLGFNIP